AWLFCIGAGIWVIHSRFADSFPLDAEQLKGVATVSRELLFLMGGATLAVLLGLIDDKIAMSAKVKFTGQFVIALIAVFLGGVKFNIFPEYPVCSTAFTLFWIMLLMNSINFFDNMDGLAVGTVAIAMALFAAVAALNGQFLVASFSALNCGVCCGFWFYNANPATIFMGDSGSHFIGYLAAIISSQVTFFDKSFSLSRFPVLMPMFILALPLFDTLMVVLIRTRNKKPFWIGDHNHISHRFVRMGLDRKQAVQLVHLMALAIGIGILPVFWGNFTTAAILVFQSLILLLIVTCLQLWLSKKSDAKE
ncbi:MAG: undecaprenyl/decaprenyl-phosphate alpha-N-acetylglucosaminyl 1-phosphate transferase, partial [Lentisphaeria bacterium]|nr:undecaprenyl/decaprenyl-phosphate alpha-N-acetylglucosaminyl 1-phosphate transferase [Lentisphaeria bacterium]